MQKTLYDSKDFEYDKYILQDFLIKNKNDDSNFESVLNRNIKCNEIKVIDKSIFMEIYFVFNVKTDEAYKKLQSLIEMLNANDLFDKYKNFECRNKCKIFPNVDDKDFYIEFFDSRV